MKKTILLLFSTFLSYSSNAQCGDFFRSLKYLPVQDTYTEKQIIEFEHNFYSKLYKYVKKSRKELKSTNADLFGLTTGLMVDLGYSKDENGYARFMKYVENVVENNVSRKTASSRTIRKMSQGIIDGINNCTKNRADGIGVICQYVEGLDGLQRIYTIKYIPGPYTPKSISIAVKKGDLKSIEGRAKDYTFNINSWEIKTFTVERHKEDLEKNIFIRIEHNLKAAGTSIDETYDQRFEPHNIEEQEFKGNIVYAVTTQTGFEKYNKSDSDFYIQFKGNKGVSDYFKLDIPKPYNDREKGQIDKYRFVVDNKSVGEIHAVNIQARRKKTEDQIDDWYMIKLKVINQVFGDKYIYTGDGLWIGDGSKNPKKIVTRTIKLHKL